MARPLRVHIPGALYHVMSRGNARQAIFLDADDYEYFLERLSATTARFDVMCRAYCLMPNHFHLLVEPGQFPLSRMMHQLNATYSQRFNRRHERVGHVLQGRFKALLIDVDDYFHRVLRYIALNPVRSALVAHPKDWTWGSYRATAGIEESPAFLVLDRVWAGFDTDHTKARERYAEFVTAECSETEDQPTGPVVSGSDEFRARVAPALEPHRDERELVYAERFACRPSLDRLFADLWDVDAIDSAISDAFERHGYTLREIGEFLGRPPATVWRRVRRGAVTRRSGRC
jgi:REP-associated tyrosine transposase